MTLLDSLSDTQAHRGPRLASFFVVLIVMYVLNLFTSLTSMFPSVPAAMLLLQRPESKYRSGHQLGIDVVLKSLLQHCAT